VIYGTRLGLFSVINRGLGLFATVALLAVACGSGTTSNSGTTGTLDLAPFQAAANAAKAAAVWHGPTTKVTPKMNGKAVFIACPQVLTGCHRGPKYMAPVAQALHDKYGWQVTDLSIQGPSELPSAMAQAINLHPDVIILLGNDENFMRSQIKDALSKGIRVVSCCAGNQAGGPDGVEIEIVQDPVAMGIAVANDMIVEQKGQVHLMTFQDYEYPVIVQYENAAVDFLKQHCPACTFEGEQRFIGDDVVTRLPDLTTSAVRSHPKVNTLLIAYDSAAIFMIPALKNAGLSGQVKLFSQVGIPQAYTNIGNGDETATMGEPISYEIWAMFDAAIRMLNGQTVAGDSEGDPIRLIDKTNLPPAGTDWEADETDYITHYKALWGIT
jgi:ribose transport system substrate-binding protein